MGPVEPEIGDPANVIEYVHDDTKPVPLSTIQNVAEFENEARKVVSKKAWVYFHSAADSLAAHQANRQDWARINLRPRILIDVRKVDMRSRFMGHDSALPFFICPAAQARLGHQDGELTLARGAARFNIPYCSSTYSSVAHTDLAKELRKENKGGALLWQLYVPTAQEGAKSLIAEARRCGFKALVVTVDSAVIGKREEDDRYKAELDVAAGIEIKRTTTPWGEAPILRGVHSAALCWDDLVWIKEAWGNSGPILLKGIQTAEDALLAYKAGVDGIYLSNHGGRQMDFAPSSLQTLLEIRKFYPHLIKEMEVILDGGVSRGTDVIKALCLGANAVGLGRPFMYALSTYGTEGVCKVIQRKSNFPCYDASC
jgi:L-lactate dehydrogenase (cytochrome)